MRNYQRRIEPLPGQESVWDYPRPPRMEESQRHIRVIYNGVTLASTRRARRIVETSHPPVYYLPAQDVQWRFFKPATRSTFCEWKGAASYYSIAVGAKTLADAAWYYPHPAHPYEALANYIAFYPAKMDACYVDDERVQAQAGDFYGGWITSEIVGPFKGSAGTFEW
jgi:uncharacterized protein (DUF427 family)